jgi:hypothetical protein
MTDKPSKLSENDWDVLLRRISKGTCTPILGAGACAGQIPLAREVAERWAEKHRYPLTDSDNLARVAQFVAIKIDDDIVPKEDIADLCSTVQPPNFAERNQIHGVLADLTLPIYITTNYDDFMIKALEEKNREPRQELCQWNGFVQDNFRSIFERESDYEPSVARPLVYHLHGSKDMPQSMVLTEDDYLEFLVWFAREWATGDRSLLPAPIAKALVGTSLLFIGYSRTDWSFRVVFRGLVDSLHGSSRMKSVAVQLDPLPSKSSENERERARSYLERYFAKIEKIQICVFWGTASEFAEELRSRWEKLQDVQAG